jgi:hypothetical protein
VTPPRAIAPAHAPYGSAASNAIYNLLFGDDPEAFRARPGEEPAAWQRLLAGDPADVPALQRLAGDAAQEGRVRYLACARLRQVGAAAPEKALLGVVVEVGLGRGLDVLAAYSDGGVRYINHTGKMVVLEGVDELRPLVRVLLDASAQVVARVGPWEHARRPPPEEGGLRLSFLVSDGLYFGEGPAEALQQDALAGPVFQAATRLLVKVIERGRQAR